MARSLLQPFLKTGLTLAVVQSEKILPVEIDIWKSNLMTGAISSLSSFRVIDLIPSGSGALSGLRLDTFQFNVDFRLAALESFRYSDRKIVLEFIYA